MLKEIYETLGAESPASFAPASMFELSPSEAKLAGLRRFGPGELRRGVDDKPATLEDALVAHGLLDGEMRALLARARYGPLDRPLVAPNHDRPLHELLDSDAFRSLVSERRATVRSNLFAQLACEVDSQVGIVDVGFESSAQDLVAEAIPDADLVCLGVYLALLPAVPREVAHPERRVGAIFDFRRGWGMPERAVLQLRWLFESACGEGGIELAALQAGIREAVTDAGRRPALHLSIDRIDIQNRIERLAFLPSVREAMALGALERAVTRGAQTEPTSLLRRAALYWKPGLLVRIGGRPLCEAYYQYQRRRVS